MHATECNRKPVLHFVIVIKSNHMGFTLCKDLHNCFKIISHSFLSRICYGGVWEGQKGANAIQNVFASTC